MRPVLEHRLVDALRAVQVLAPIVRDARVENLVVAALDDVDRVDLYVAEMLDRGADRSGTVTKRCGFVEALGVQPDAPGVGERELYGSLMGLWNLE